MCDIFPLANGEPICKKTVARRDMFKIQLQKRKVGGQMVNIWIYNSF